MQLEVSCTIHWHPEGFAHWSDEYGVLRNGTGGEEDYNDYGGRGAPGGRGRGRGATILRREDEEDGATHYDLVFETLEEVEFFLKKGSRP